MAGTITSTSTFRKAPAFHPRITKVDIDFTCASGAVDATSIGSFFGRLLAYITDGTAGAGATMTATADILLTDAWTGAPVLTDSTFATSDYVRPTGVMTNRSDGTAYPTNSAPDHVGTKHRDIFIAGELKAAIANATTTDTGRLSLIIGEG
jgi:hypothetical protein